MRGLHGLGGREAAGAERVPDEATRRDGRPRTVRLEDAEGRAQRGDARRTSRRPSTSSAPSPARIRTRCWSAISRA
jgi:hypothetical protein